MSVLSIRLAIVDGNTLFRKILTQFLSDQKNINVHLQSSDVHDLLNHLRNYKIDLLLIDILTARGDSIEAFRFIRNEHPDIRILVCSMNTDLAFISNLLDLGIHGYVSKTDDPEELLNAIQSVSSGLIHRNKLFTEALYWSKQTFVSAAVRRKNEELNEREKVIIQLLWEELDNREIAGKLFLSVRSIEKIRQGMKEKLGVRSTVGLLKYAMKEKIISAGAGVSVH